MSRFMVGGRGDGLVCGQPPSYLFRAKSLRNNVCGLGVGSHIQWISPNRQFSQSDSARLVSVKSRSHERVVILIHLPLMSF